jgi:hypothetical protein
MIMAKHRAIFYSGVDKKSHVYGEDVVHTYNIYNICEEAVPDKFMSVLSDIMEDDIKKKWKAQSNIGIVLCMLIAAYFRYKPSGVFNECTQ